MKKTKSLLVLNNLALSIKQSISRHSQKYLKEDFLPLKNSSSSIHLKVKSSLGGQYPLQELRQKAEQKQNHIFILQKQIAYLEKQVYQTKSSIRNYSKQLTEYETTSQKVNETEKMLFKEQQSLNEMRNQMLMLQAEAQSTRFNLQQKIAEKQYYEELIQTYSFQYDAESKEVLMILDLQKKNTVLQRQVEELKLKYQQSTRQFQTWKKQTDFDLNEHKLKNNIKILRMELISYEDKCDIFCSTNNLRKIRELYCIYFKNYCKANGVSNSEAEGGIDLFICKNSLVDDFSEFVKERIVYGKIDTEDIEKYLSILSKIQQIFRKNHNQINKKWSSLYKNDIKDIQKEIEEKIVQKKINLDQMTIYRNKIDALFNDQSIAVIEYLRQQNLNKYDLKDIKIKLKEIKKDQQIRIHKIEEVYKKNVAIDTAIEKNSDNITIIEKQNFQQINKIGKKYMIVEQRITEITQKLSQLLTDKEKIENIISSAITKWKDRDQNKIKLKKLYKELQQAKQSNGFAISKNQFQSISFKNLNNNEELKFTKHNKQQSILSHDRKSKKELCLTNPYKKIMKRSEQQYDPILQDCQMILSRKLSIKQMLNTEDKENDVLKDAKVNIEMKATKKNSSLCRYSSKENDRIMKKDNSNLCGSKYSIATKLNTSSKLKKGKVAQSERVSLSNMLISKFNR